MNPTSKFLLILLILLCTSLLYAGDLRVTVNPFESKEGDKDIAKRVTVMSAREVMRSKGFIYKSMTDFFRDVIGKEKAGDIRFTNLEEEYSEENLKKLEGIARPHQGFDNFSKALEAADITLGGTVERVGSRIKVESTIVNTQSTDHETYEEVIECDESHLNDEVQKSTRSLLNKILRGIRICADKLTDKKWSKVMYEVISVDRQWIGIEMDFTGTRPSPEIQNVRIIPPEGLDVNSATTLKVRSQEGKIIDIVFTYKMGQLDNIRVDTPMPDLSSDAEQREVLTMKSRAGYLLTFTFEWKNKAMQSAKIDPKVNPFGGSGE